MIFGLDLDWFYQIRDYYSILILFYIRWDFCLVICPDFLFFYSASGLFRRGFRRGRCLIVWRGGFWGLF